MNIEPNINYDELLDEWAEEVFAKADQAQAKRDECEDFSYRDGVLKGMYEAYYLAVAMLTRKEDKFKKKHIGKTL